MENHVADQIRFYRRQEGLTQEQLAEAMGVSVAAVSKWEQGQSLPEIPMLMELADFFDLSVDALLGYRLRSNDRKSVSERLKVLRREDRYDEGLAEAEKALQKFPNTFTVVYECAKLFEMAGGTRKDKALQRRALDLLTHAIRLLPQNSDPQVSEMSLRLDMANVLLDMEDARALQGEQRLRAARRPDWLSARARQGAARGGRTLSLDGAAARSDIARARVRRLCQCV